ncbi:hypothetical protein BOTBODRAFT_112040 [Botryobasidium botryosum FD-172 SS1]|uniref:Phosphatidylinositol transfer protein SFH5 n=1 Tax=Botryobasidium botryosum (strain FD-172 SS1) TaxID=930990 RepID=A0A067MB68_BOTB1|nr:hypothetical protein BOTBODRAFT_112040 [Botryobasidium botryosum FD-172 SS1]
MTANPPPTAAPEISEVAPAQEAPKPLEEAPAEVKLTVEEEPQNDLTRKFTEAEWAKVKELRTTLPLIFEEAFKGKENPQAPVDLWGVNVDPARVDDARVSVILVKFLRARNLNVEEAGKMLTSTLKWREEYKAAETADEEFPQDVFGGIGFVAGRDKEGRPITYNVYGGNKDLKAVFGDFDRFMRWRVGLMEKGLKLIDFETVDSMVQVHDYEGVGMGSRDANSKRAASEATKIFGDYYPELLHKKFFVNVPIFMTWIFWLFKAIVPAATFGKLQVVGTGPSTIGKEMLKIVDKDQLPKKYGGEAEALQ